MIQRANKNNLNYIQEREGIREQLRISRSLTDHKLEREEASDTEDENEADVQEHLKLLQSTEKSDNPWLLGGGKSLDDENDQNNIGKQN